jgi:hypothetical protein
MKPRLLAHLVPFVGRTSRDERRGESDDLSPGLEKEMENEPEA